MPVYGIVTTVLVYVFWGWAPWPQGPSSAAPLAPPQGRAWRQPTIHTRYKAQSKSTSAPNSHCNKQVTLATTLQYITTPKKRCNSIPLLASTRSSRCHKQVAIATQLKYITTPKKSCN